MGTSDIELWQEILDGDAKSWETLVRRYQSLIYAIAIRSGLSMSDAADCFQQTWLALYQHRRRIKDPSRLSAWLVTTAKREALRLLSQSPSVSTSNTINDPADPNPLADNELIRLERQAHLEAALKQLDPRCRRLLETFFLSSEDKSYEEIAATLGLAANSIGPIRRRCLERLKRILLENGFPGVRDGDERAL